MRHTSACSGRVVRWCGLVCLVAQSARRQPAPDTFHAHGMRRPRPASPLGRPSGQRALPPRRSHGGGTALRDSGAARLLPPTRPHLTHRPSPVRSVWCWDSGRCATFGGSGSHQARQFAGTERLGGRPVASPVTHWFDWGCRGNRGTPSGWWRKSSRSSASSRRTRPAPTARPDTSRASPQALLQWFDSTRRAPHRHALGRRR